MYVYTGNNAAEFLFEHIDFFKKKVIEYFFL